MLIENWKLAYKYVSVQLAALLVTLSTLVEFLPQIAAYLPNGWVQALGAAILIARIIQQKQMAVKASEECKDVVAN